MIPPLVALSYLVLRLRARAWVLEENLFSIRLSPLRKTFPIRINELDINYQIILLRLLRRKYANNHASKFVRI